MSRLRESGYLDLLAIAAPLSYFVLFLAPTATTVGGIPLHYGVFCVVVLAAALAWPLAERVHRPDRWLWTFLALLAAMWMLSLGLTLWRGGPTNVTTVTVPVIVLLLAAKPLGFGAVLRSMDVLAWALAVTTWVAFVMSLGRFSATGAPAVIPPVCPPAPGFDLGPLLEDSRLSISSWFGLGERWGGTVDSPNVLGQFAVLLLVFGLSRRGPNRVGLVLSGAFFLMLTGSRTSIIAGAAGVLLLVVLPRRVPWIPISRTWRLVIAGTLVSLVVVNSLLRNPQMSGRAGMWVQMMDVWRTSRVTGVGQSGIDAAIASCGLPPWAIHGHNFAVDALVRTGVVGLLLVLAVLTVAAIISFRAALRGPAVSAAIFGGLIVGGLADRTIEFQHPTVRWIGLMVLPVLLAWAWLQEHPKPDDPPAEPDPVETSGRAEP